MIIFFFFFGCENVQSLCGHTSPVESVAFDSAEVLVLAGASTGVIKLWDLEEVKSKSIS
jgi:katanin p80 WD40 repeat-containing subunit B1